MAPDQPFWRTSISRVRLGETLVRGHDLIELIGTRGVGYDGPEPRSVPEP